jgi:hypothetical protein
MGEYWPVLTIRQPWQFAIEHGKPVENRTWNMTYRGPLWLHAGARSRWDPAGERHPLVRLEWEQYVRRIPGWPGLPVGDVELGRKTTLMPFGAVSALAEVAGCHHAGDCGVTVPERPRLLVMCTPWAAQGQFHITLENVRPLPEPVPCRGMLGLWRLPDDVEKAVRAQLSAQSEASTEEEP